MTRLTLGAKLTLWSALIVVAALVASALTSDIFVYRTERRELDEDLRQSARHFFEQYHAHGSQIDWITSRQLEEVFSPHDKNRFIEVQDSEGRVLYRSPNLPGSLGKGPGLRTSHIGDTKVRVGVFPQSGLTLLIAGNMAEFTDLVTELVIGHLVALPFILGFVGLGGWWLGRQALRPIQAMAIAAAAIQPEELDRRLPEPAPADEIGRLARVFNAMLARLQRGFQQATRFSTDASHELRTPLSVLRASVEDLLEDPTLTDTQREAVGELQFQTQRLISITNTLLLLARADAGRLSLQLEDADLRDLVVDCYDDARILAEQKGVQLACHLDDPGPVRVDPLRIRQALLNLLENAVKYNVPDGRVDIRLVTGDGRCRVKVGSTGQEIPPAEQAGIFGRFFRAGQHEDMPGSGLGLSLARELARGHRGDVVLTSSREGWNEFELILPMRSSPSNAPSSASEPVSAKV